MKKFTGTKSLKSNMIMAFAVGCLTLGMSINVQAESGASHHSGQASKHSALAVSHTAVGTTKVASAVVAAPLIVAGGVSVVTGSAVLAVGDSMADAANASSYQSAAQNTQKLIISDVIITADQAPNVAIKNDKQQQTTKITTTETKKTVIETQ